MGEEVQGEQERERKREYMREWRRARREARVNAGLCVRCGAPLAEGDAAGGRVNCAPCREYQCAATEKSRVLYRPREEQRRAERREREQAEREAARNAPGAPFCPHCGGRDVKKGGREDGKQKYLCRGCGRSSYGRPKVKRGGDHPCPNRGCGGNCRKHGRDKKGRQLYHCPKCGRFNTRLWPTEPRAPGGPFPYLRTFYLSLLAERALNDYIQKHGLSPARAVRAIFRAWADEPTGGLPLVVGRDAWGDRETLPHRPVVEERERIPRRLPDLRRAANVKRMASGNRLHMTVLVTWRLSVALDAAAYQGLLRYMRRTGLNHQDAARAMIRAAGRDARGDNDWWLRNA